jgi:hypothetical protein
MMTDEECIKFMSKMADSLEKAFSHTIQKHLPPDNKMPLDVMFTGIAMFVAVTAEHLYRTSGVPIELQLADTKDFCKRLESVIVQAIQKRNIH